MQPMLQLVEWAAIPAPRLKKAPDMFNGAEDDITEFLEVYEYCADVRFLHLTSFSQYNMNQIFIISGVLKWQLWGFVVKVYMLI